MRQLPPGQKGKRGCWVLLEASKERLEFSTGQIFLGVGDIWTRIFRYVYEFSCFLPSDEEELDEDEEEDEDEEDFLFSTFSSSSCWSDSATSVAASIREVSAPDK
jgi:hypothetical protein